MSSKFSELEERMRAGGKQQDGDQEIMYEALKIADGVDSMIEIGKHAPLSAEERKRELGRDGEIKHYPIGVNSDGQGPVMPGDPDYRRTVCWCGKEGCEEYK